MNQRIIAAWKPLAVFGLALALAGCNKTGTTTTAGTTTASSGAATDALATVGGTPITRDQLSKVMEAQYGKQFLPVLINAQLVEGAAKDAGVTVSDAEVSAELDKMRKKTPQMDKQLTENPMLVDVYKTLAIRSDLLTQKLLTKDVKAPTDAELQKFYNSYKAYYGEPAKIKIGALLTSSKERADVMSRALKSKGKTFEQLVAEQQKAQDPAAASSRDGDSFFAGLSAVDGDGTGDRQGTGEAAQRRHHRPDCPDPTALANESRAGPTLLHFVSRHGSPGGGLARVCRG